MSGKCRSDIGDLLTGLLDLFTRKPDLRKCRAGNLRLTLEVLQLCSVSMISRCRAIVLLLRDVAVGKCLICLLCCRFQGFQLFFGSCHRIGEEFMLLREQFRVGRIELQQLLYILELRLRVLDVFIDAFQCFGQLGGIAADLNGNTLDSVCHAVHLLREDMKKAPAEASAFL